MQSGMGGSNLFSVHIFVVNIHDVLRVVVDVVKSVLLEMGRGIRVVEGELDGTDLAPMHHLRQHGVSICQTILPILQVVLPVNVSLHLHLAVDLLRAYLALVVALVYPGLGLSCGLDRRFSRR